MRRTLPREGVSRVDAKLSIRELTRLKKSGCATHLQKRELEERRRAERKREWKTGAHKPSPEENKAGSATQGRDFFYGDWDTEQLQARWKSLQLCVKETESLVAQRATVSRELEKRGVLQPTTVESRFFPAEGESNFYSRIYSRRDLFCAGCDKSLKKGTEIYFSRSSSSALCCVCVKDINRRMRIQIL